MARMIDADELKRRMCDLCNRDYSDEPCDPSDCIFIRAIDESPTLTPPNDPLTLEQLREMDGEPVWFVDIKGRKWYPPGWAIVDRENCLVRLVKSWNPIFFEKYGEWWLAYRRPPEDRNGR